MVELTQTNSFSQVSISITEMNYVLDLAGRTSLSHYVDDTLKPITNIPRIQTLQSTSCTQVAGLDLTKQEVYSHQKSTKHSLTEGHFDARTRIQQQHKSIFSRLYNNNVWVYLLMWREHVAAKLQVSFFTQYCSHIGHMPSPHVDHNNCNLHVDFTN
jgi:hypothetical protein